MHPSSEATSLETRSTPEREIRAAVRLTCQMSTLRGQISSGEAMLEDMSVQLHMIVDCCLGEEMQYGDGLSDIALLPIL